MNKKLSRRDFLKMAGVTSVGLVLSACGVKATDLPTATLVSPTETIIPTITSVPTSTPPLPLEQLPQTKQALAEFVQAFKAVGVDISSDQLIQKGLEIRTITGKDKEQLEIALINIENSDGLGGNYPLMIKAKGEWKQYTPQNSPEITYMTAVDLGDANHNEPAYDKTIQNIFSGLVVSGGFAAKSIDKYPPDRFVSELVNNPKLNLTRIAIFDHNDLTPNTGEQVIRDRINKLIPHITRILKDSTKHIILDIANEAMWWNDANQYGFEKGYGSNGNKWIVDAGNELINALLANSVSAEQISNQIQIGIDNEYRVEIPVGLYAKKSAFVLGNAKQFADAIQKEHSDVQLNFSIGMEFHIGTVSPDPNDLSHYFVDYSFFDSPNAENQLTKHFQTFGDSGFKLNITEFDFDNSIPIETKVKIITIVVNAVQKSGNVNSFNFWNGLRSNTKTGWTNKPDLFDFSSVTNNGEYAKTVLYYALCKSIIDSRSVSFLGTYGL